MKKSNFLIFLFFVTISHACFSFYFGPQIIYKSYKEKLPPNLKAEDKGVLQGFRGGLSMSLVRLIYADIDIDYTQGKTNYSAVKYDSINKEYYSISNITDNKLLNAEGNIGVLLSVKRISLKPYWGIGYHLWERKLEDYTESYDWLFFNFGAVLDIKITPEWDIGLDVKGMQPKFTNIEVDKIYPWQQDVSLFNEMQYAIKIYNKFHVSFVTLYLSAFYKNMKIGSSKRNDNSLFYAPPSSDKIYGAEMILEYGF